jgi:putative ABC transport system permease protein
MSGGVELTTFDYDPATGRATRTTADPDRVLAAITPELPPFEADVIPALDLDCSTSDEDCAPGSALAQTPPENECFLWSLVGEPSEAERRRAEQDPRCTQSEVVISGSFRGTPVGGAAVLETIARVDAPPAAVDTLAAGGVVVFQQSLLSADGTVLLDVVSPEEATVAMREGRDPQARQVELPAAYVRTAEAAADLVYSPGAAESLGFDTTPSTLFLRFETLPTQAEEEEAYQALSDAGVEAYLSIERGYVSDYGLGVLALVVGAGVITLGAAGIATGLAQADARADHATLAAVGAAPRLRRTLAAAQALSISGLGTALGVAAGFVPAVALIGAIPSLELVVPWWQLTQVLVIVPLIAGGSAWLLTRSRVPLERRVA